jgi:hypothetical protein
MPSRIVTTAIFLGITALAVDGIILTQLRRGFFDLTDAAQTAKPLRIPGSSELMRSHYTGIEPIDKFLVSLLVFFYPIVEGKSAPLSIFTTWVVGQVAATQTLVMLEGLRRGNRGKLIS